MNDGFVQAKHPLSRIRPSSSPRPVPDFLFGDSLVTAKKENPDGKWAGAPWVRAWFSFAATEPVDPVKQKSASPISSDKGKAKLNKAPSKPKQTKLTLNSHFDDEHYDPAAVERFSPNLQQWCAITHLQTRKQQSKNKSAVTNGAPTSRGPHYSTDLLATLGRLSNQNIVRGGIYGLTGNAFIVTRAGELSTRLGKLAASQSQRKQEERAGLVEEAEELVKTAGVWEAAVQARRGKGMAEGRAPAGEVWVCPSDGKTEI